jgi:hypothetical protein
MPDSSDTAIASAADGRSTPTARSTACPRAGFAASVTNASIITSVCRMTSPFSNA